MENKPVIRFPLLPQIGRGKFHPHVLKKYTEWRAELYRACPNLAEMEGHNIEEYLSPGEAEDLRANLKVVGEWLGKSGTGSETECRHFAYDVPHDAMQKVKNLIQKAALCQETDRETKAALAAMDPPFDDAEKYLGSSEYHLFKGSALQAIDAYLAWRKHPGLLENNPDVWLQDPEAYEYTIWLSVINERKDIESRKIAARSEYASYMRRVDSLLKEFELELSGQKKPELPIVLPEYEPDRWYDLDIPQQEEIKDWLLSELRSKIPPELMDLLSWDFDYDISVLPTAEYVLAGIPCLIWFFSVQLLITVKLAIGKPSSRLFRGIPHRISIPPKALGELYIGPFEWNYQEGFTSPITLLEALSQGEMEAEGIRVLGRDGSRTSFEIDGFDGDDAIEIDDRFRQFLIDTASGKPLAEGLLAAGIVDKPTASLIEAKMGTLPPLKGEVQPQTGQAASDEDEVRDKLQALGYKASEISQMIAATQFPPGMSLDEKLQAALKMLGT